MALYGTPACRIEFLSSGFRALLMGPGVRDYVYRNAKAIAEDAGEGFGVDIRYGQPGSGTRGRVLGFVSAWTPEAREKQASEKVLKIAAERPRGA